MAKGVATAIFVATAKVATASGELPFGFGGQAEGFAGEGIQFGDKLLTIVPRNLLNRQICALKTAWVDTHHRLPERLGHFRFANAVGRQRHFMRGHFISVGIAALLSGGTHGEGTAFHAHHFKGYAIGFKSINLRRGG